MDVHNTIGGSLQISTEVIAKIARLAALEVDGVADVVHIPCNFCQFNVVSIIIEFFQNMPRRFRNMGTMRL